MVKLLAVLLVSACLGVPAHAQGKARGDLRSALKQSVQLGSNVPSQRQLSPEERAELRRQLIQHSPRPGKRD